MDASAAATAFLHRGRRPTNTYEETVERLLQAIRLGIIAPAERLPSERDLAELLKVGRNTVREALSTLVEHGYVVSKRGRYGGTFVADALPERDVAVGRRRELDEEELENISVLRRVLDVGAARVTAGRDLTAAERATLQAVLDESMTANAADYRRLDSKLHLTIAELTGSSDLVRLMADLRTRVNQALGALPLLAPNLTNSNDQHSAIVHAILAGYPDVAAQAMLEHVEGSDALLRGFLTSG
ncbi:FadR/GntR family transcriptional regulator [Microbacterium soli]|uniref:GntR family transcriptional regulator n=1 Tax=Microbacterium soli TaxID=446075 RepID=A0ABP7N3Z7_9MICO